MNNLAESPETEKKRTDLRRWIVVIGAGFFATTFPQPAILRLPLQYLLKTDLGISREAMASFFALGTLAWYFKPLAGIVSDSMPLFGTRRRHYLILSAIAAGIFWVVTGMVPRTYGALMLSVIAVNAMLVIGSTVAGGVMVEMGQKYGATGRLCSARFFVENACVLLGGPVGGFLAARAFGLTAAVGAVSALSVAPIAWWLLQEPRVAQRSGESWTNAKVQLRTLMHSGALWSAAGLFFLVYISPGFATPLYYFQVDTLKFSQEFIGTLALLSGSFGLLGAFLYGTFCKRISLRWLLALGIALSALGSLCYLLYRSHGAAAVIESENGLLVTLAELALMDLAVRATPKGSESLGFALMMSLRNGALAISDISGSWLMDRHHISFYKLVWINSGTTAAVLLALPFLPRILLDRHDEDAPPAPEAVTAMSSSPGSNPS